MDECLKKYMFLFKIKLHSPIEWSLKFQASTSTLYVKNKMVEASLLPQRKRKNVSSSFFNFMNYVGILSRTSLKKNWCLKLSQKASELIYYLFIYLNTFFLLGM